jgi:hypothetical protein
MSNVVPFDGYVEAVPPARSGPGAVIALADDYWRLANRVSATEFVPSKLRNRPEAVLAALLSGAERGLGPMESLRSINVIEGTPSLSAEAKRALVLAAGHDIDIVESTAMKCTVNGRRRGSDHTTSFTWTIDRARRANLANKDNWRKYPEAMLLARATSELCNAVFPDITAGLATTEEISDELALEPTTTRRKPPATRRHVPPAPESLHPAPAAAAAPTTTPPPAPRAAVSDDTDLGGIPGADEPSWATQTPAPEPVQPADPEMAKRIHAEIAKAFPDASAATRDRYRHALVACVTRRRPAGVVASSAGLSYEEQLELSKRITDILAGRASVADGPDDTVEVRPGGGWTYTVSFDPLAVVGSRSSSGEALQPDEVITDDQLTLSEEATQ